MTRTKPTRLSTAESRQVLAAVLGAVLAGMAVVAAAVGGGALLRYVVGIGVLGVTMCSIGLVILVQQRRRHLAVAQQLRSSLSTATKRIDARIRRSEIRIGEAMQRETWRTETKIAAVAREVAQIEAVTALYHRLDITDELPGFQGFVAAPGVLVMLYDLVRSERPTVVLGCGSGASTVVLARAIQRNGGGRVIALEHIERHAHATRSIIERASLGHIATVIDAPLIERQVGEESHPWYNVERAGDIDSVGLLFIEGPPPSVGPSARYPALPTLANSLVPGAFVIVADAARDDEQAVLARWQKAFDLEVLSRANLTCDAMVMRYRGSSSVEPE